MSHVTTLLMATTDTALKLPKRKLTALLVTAMLLAGCRVKAPSVEEQAALTERGAFPRGVPAWSSGAVKASSFRGIQAPGVIPNQYGRSSLPTSMERPNVNREEVAARARLEQQEMQGASETRERDSSQEKASSELGRIEALCPTVLDDVTDALTTVETESRIKQYRRLTSRCPESYDLWLWLAQDFYSAGRNAEAERAANRVLSLDPGNAGAAAIINNIRSK